MLDLAEALFKLGHAMGKLSHVPSAVMRWRGSGRGQRRRVAIASVPRPRGLAAVCIFACMSRMLHHGKEIGKRPPLRFQKADKFGLGGRLGRERRDVILPEIAYFGCEHGKLG